MPENKEEVNIKNYQPTEGPTNRQLEVGLWWVRNRQLLYKIMIGLLTFISTISWGWTLYNFGHYAFQGVLDDRQLMIDILEPEVNRSVVQLQQAKDLEIGSIVALNGANNTYDLAVKVRNPNEQWYLRFDYSFTGKDKVQSDFIMPRETKYITSFLNEGTRSNVQLQLTNVEWHRVNARDVPDVGSFTTEHNDIKISNIKIKPIQLGAGSPLQQVNFTVQNNSAYNYWEVDLHLLAESGSSLLGINKYTLDMLSSGERREVSVLWSGHIPSYNIAITPSIDIFDEDNYMPFELGVGQIK